MKKRILVLLTAVILAASLAACTTTSSSSSTVTTSVTNGNGQTTTTTTTTENGQTTTDTTVTGAQSETLRPKWEELFQAGAEGTNASGEKFYFAYDDPENISEGAVMIVSADGSELPLYMLGEIRLEDGKYVLYDVEGQENLPFEIVDGQTEETFGMLFKDGDVAEMTPVDKDTIIEDMLSIIDMFTPAE